MSEDEANKVTDQSKSFMTSEGSEDLNLLDHKYRDSEMILVHDLSILNSIMT